jgi:hypothetical protein
MGLSAVAAAGAFALIASTPSAAPEPIDVGTAAVALGDDTARSVEQVAYRHDVDRVGDVVVVDGTPSPTAGADVLAASPEVASLWSLVEQVWPTWLDDELHQFSVVEEAPRGLVGVVHPTSGGGWVLSLDLADLDDRHLVRETIVHELSHVITLDADVFTFGHDTDCEGVEIELGCAAAGSVLAEYAQTFWPDDLPSSDPHDHVNEYATTGVHEDLAETFTAWALDWPIGSPTVQAKIDLLATDPDLARLASDLRARLASS